MARDGVPVGPELAALVVRRANGDRMNVRTECTRLGVSTSTFYKYLARFEELGIEGFYPRSRRPLLSPSRMGPQMEDLVVRARKQLAEDGWDEGADSIRFRLRDLDQSDPSQWPVGEPLPSRATVNRILTRRGQVITVPQRRPKAADRRFQAAHPNGRWQMDGFEVTLADETTVVVLHILDDCSRYDLACHVAVSENSRDVWAALSHAAACHGLPAEVLTDNGTAFSGRRRGWTSPLEANLATVGVRHITSSIRHPQTCGKVERAHKTARKWLARRPAFPDIAALQQALDTYRHDYNHHRCKTHLDGMTPAQRYQLGPIDGPTGHHHSPLIIKTARVSASGCIRIDRTLVGVGRRHRGQTVTVFRHAQRVSVFAQTALIAEFDLVSRSGYQAAHATVSEKS
jgi:transposase InsO family protein